MNIYNSAEDDEFISEMRLWMKQNPLDKSDLPKQKIPAWNKGISPSEETRRLCGLAAKRKVFTDEMRENYRKSKLGDKNPMFGKKFSPQELKEMSERFSGSKNPMYGKKRPELLWWTDGQKNKRCNDCPGPNWKKGRLSYKKKRLKIKN